MSEPVRDILGRHHGGGGRGGRGGRRRFYGGGWGGYGYGPYDDWYGPDVDIDIETVNVGAHAADPLVAEINRRTDERFWAETKYKPGQRLDRNDPADAEWIPAWIDFRYDIAQEVAAENARHQAHARQAIDRFTGKPMDLAIADETQKGVLPMSVGIGRAATRNNAGSLLSLLPILAPGASGLTAKMSIDADQILHVAVCIDGHCYERSVDLGAVLDGLAARVASYHAQLHVDAGAPLPTIPSPNVAAHAAAAADTATTAAGEMIIGALAAEHTQAICAGWWHSLTHPIASAEHAISSAATGVAHTLKALKTPISIAAAGAAVYFVGPTAGPMAAQLTGSLIDAANGDASAQQVVQAAQQAAQSDPQIAQALNGAQQAVTQATAAYHTVNTVAQAAQGNPQAIQQVQQLAQAATAGDPAAAKAMQLVSQVDQVAQGNGGGGISSAIPSIGDAASAVEAAVSGASPMLARAREAAAQKVAQAKARSGGAVFGFVRDGNGYSVLPFPSLDDADDWYGALSPGAFLYAAYFDASDPTWPAPVSDKLGGSAATVSGAMWPLLALGIGVGSAYGVHRFYKHAEAKRVAAALAAAAPAR